MSGEPFQVMPPLSPEEYAALRADIERHGILVPIVVDQDGVILDGHHRAAIGADLGIDVPKVTRTTASDDERRHIAYTLNLARRHLSREQVREIIRAELERDNTRPDRAIGRLVGVDHKTVGAVRHAVGKFPTDAELVYHPDPAAEAAYLRIRDYWEDRKQQPDFDSPRWFVGAMFDAVDLVDDYRVLAEAVKRYGEDPQWEMMADSLRDMGEIAGEIAANWTDFRNVGRLHPGLTAREYVIESLTGYVTARASEPAS